MKRLAAGLIVAGLAGACSASAQEPSLGEVARREKAKRGPARSGEAARVFTNTDLEAIRSVDPRGNLNVLEAPEGAANPPSGQERAWDEVAQQGQSAAAEGGKGGDRSEQRAAMEAAQNQLEAARGEADRLRERLSPMAQPYIQDVNERLRLQSELSAAEAAVAQAQRDLEAARRAYAEQREGAQRPRLGPGATSNAS